MERADAERVKRGEKPKFGDQESREAFMAQMFQGQYAPSTAAKLIQQRESFENHAKLYAQAMGTSAEAFKQAMESPKAALIGLQKTFEGFGAIMSGPFMQQAASGMNALTENIQKLGSYLSTPDVKNAIGEYEKLGMTIGGQVIKEITPLVTDLEKLATQMGILDKSTGGVNLGLSEFLTTLKSVENFLNKWSGLDESRKRTQDQQAGIKNPWFAEPEAMHWPKARLNPFPEGSMASNLMSRWNGPESGPTEGARPLNWSINREPPRAW